MGSFRAPRPDGWTVEKFPVQSRLEAARSIPITHANFAALGVSDRLCAALATQGITVPFPVQSLVLPEARAGTDVLVQSPTGSGKTLAFGLPIVDMLDARDATPAALVLAPTRELAAQIEEELEPLASARGLSVAVCYGGVGYEVQAKRAARAQLLVATPGRLLDLTRSRRVNLSGVRMLVLDEADRMLDMGFLPQVTDIVRRLPADRQTMFFSATLAGDVGRLAHGFTRDPVRLVVHDGPGSDEPPLSERLDHAFVACTSDTKLDALLGLIQEESDLVLVFCRTKRGADRLADRLKRADVAATALHGDLTQGARERSLKKFSAGRARVMVATDIAARGIDLDDIGLVVNYDPPGEHDAYTHRVGRTARAGRLGRAVTLVLPDQADEVGRMAVRLGQSGGFEATGYALGAPRVLYASRRRGSVFAPGRPAPRTRPAADADDAPRRGRVRRRSRPAPAS